MSSDGISKPVNVLTRSGPVNDERNAAAAAVQLLYRPLAGQLLPSVACLSASQEIGLPSEARAGPGSISWLDYEPQSAETRIKLSL